MYDELSAGTLNMYFWEVKHGIVLARVPNHNHLWVLMSLHNMSAWCEYLKRGGTVVFSPR